MSFFVWLLDIFFVPRESQLQVRKSSYEDLISHKRACLHRREYKIVSILPYRAPLVRAFIAEAKFHASKKAHMFLGRALREFLNAYYFPSLRQITLVPMPLSIERKRQRGYNQAEEIIRYGVEGLRIEVDIHILVRVRDTLPQTTLPKELRHENLKNAFVVAKQPDPHTLYIVVDDVFTTGATLSAAFAAFQDAGITRVSALTLAY